MRARDSSLEVTANRSTKSRAPDQDPVLCSRAENKWRQTNTPNRFGINSRSKTTILIFFVLSVAVPSAATGVQEPANNLDTEKANVVLQQVAETYASAERVQVEAIEEQHHNSPLASDWLKTYLYLNRESLTKYRIEVRTPWGSYLQLSDGVTEWVSSIQGSQYIERPTSQDGPSFTTGATGGISYLKTAWTLPISLEMLVTNHRIKSVLPDEILEFSGEEIECSVIKLASGSHDDGMDRTIWIDKQHHTIRKIQTHQTQDTHNADAQISGSEDTTITFPIVSIPPQSPFRFTPVGNDQKVSHLGPLEPGLSGLRSPLIGKLSPLATLGVLNGSTVSLASYRGRPVLLEFWATWCWPCMSKMPELGELYKTAITKGLTVLTIDENEEPRKEDAVLFLQRHGFTWPNFHDTGTIAKSFSEDGVPLTILIDKDGKVVFDEGGVHIAELRAAIAKLGASFADLAR